MFSDWIAFGRDVLHFWRSASIEAFAKSWSFVGQTREGIVFATLVLIIFFFYLLRRHGWHGLWSKFWEKALEGIVIAILAFTALFLWKLFAEPWAQVSWARSQMEFAREAQRSSDSRKSGDASTIEQQTQEIAELKKRPESCPKCGTSVAPAKSSLDIVCEDLGKNYKECLHNVGKSLKGENKITMWNYQQKYQSRVMGMRTALIHRLGGRDTKQDFYYDSAASDSGSIQDLRGISTDLRNLAGEVLALRGN
jgi:hypothetical protein